MKWVHRKAINILRPPSCSIFHAQNHGTILLLKLCNPIIQMIKKHIFFKNEKNIKIRAPKKNAPKFARQDARGGGREMRGRMNGPPKLSLRLKFGGAINDPQKLIETKNKC